MFIMGQRFYSYSKKAYIKVFEMNKWIKVSTLCILFGILAFAGCVEPVQYPQIVGELPTAVLPSRYRIVGKSVQRRPIMCLELGAGTDVTFIMATIHGNEAAGTPLVRRLSWYLREHPELLSDRKVVLMAVANPDGMVNGSRYNARGVDLNRNFEAANRINTKQAGLLPLSEPEAVIIKRLIQEYNPDRIVSIHQPLNCVDYDGPGRMLAEHMGQYCALPVKKLGARPGSLGSYAGETLGIPIITFEMLQADSQLNSQALWDKYGKAMLAAILYPDPVR
jgi:protein MpaA